MNRLVVPNGILLPEVERLLAQGNDVVLMTKGSSMLPFITGDRDSVLLRRRESIEKGEIVLARLSAKRYVLHRIWEIEGDKVTLMGDGNIRGKENCGTADICGTAVQILKEDGRCVDTLSPSSRRKAKLWRALLPIRRYLLAIYRRLPNKRNKI